MRTRSRAWLLAALLALALTVPAVAQSPGTSATVESLRYTGDGNLTASDTGQYLWRSRSHEFTATVGASDSFEGDVCLTTKSTEPGGRWNLTCRTVTVPANGTRSVPLTVQTWPANATGSQSVSARLYTANSSDALDRESLHLTVIRQGGDLDDDGLSNEREATLGTGLHTADTDGDGLEDGPEVHTHDTSPQNVDTDGDGITDDAEVKHHRTDPTTADTDDDGLADRRELDHGTNPTQSDSDGDGIADGAEVNVHETDPTKPDTDGDGLDDGAEINEFGTNPLAVDTDDDGLNDALEIHTYGSDPTSVDTDDDGLEDGAEVAEYQTDPTAADTDDDGLDDGQEINTYGTNPTSPDTDDDGLRDGPEVNRYGTDPNAADSDGDGRPDGAEVDRGLTSTDPVSLAFGGVVILVLAGGLLRYRTEYDPLAGLARWIGRVRGRPTTATADSDGAADPVENTHGPADEGEATTAGRATEPDSGPSDGHRDGQAPSEVPPEFLSNEERILALLEERGGRMPQAEIVDETGMSKSTVSRVLSEMADEGRVVKIDVGSGNVIALPEAVPPGVESPLDR